MQSNYREPELIVPLEYQHYPVSFFYSERCEIICSLAGIPLYIRECETALIMINVHIYHRSLIGAFLRHSINYIIGEVELILIFEIDRTQHARIVGLALDKLFRYRM